MSDAVTHEPGSAGETKASTRQGDVPTNPLMAALHRAASDDVERRRNWLLGHSDTSTPSGMPDPAALVDEIASLREELAVAEHRADDAENALPQLMELGQRTVDGLLNDARRRGREIIQTARAQAETELGEQRDDIRREAKELDALRMAVAAEAMGLEQIRAELQRRITLSATELSRMADHPMLLGGELPVEELGLAAAALAPSLESADDAPQTDFEPDGEDLVVEDPRPVGMVEASVAEPASVVAQIEIATAAEATLDVSSSVADAPAAPTVDRAVVDTVDVTDSPVEDAEPAGPGGAFHPGSRFAEAWAADEEEGASEAFDRFFAADVGYEPSREWILADDTQE